MGNAFNTEERKSIQERVKQKEKERVGGESFAVQVCDRIDWSE